MYCFFKPTTTTKRSFFELKSINLQIYPHELQVLQEADDLRNKIILGNVQVIPQYLQLFLNYLKPILIKQSLFHPSFTYEPIVSNCILQSPLDNQEAFEVDHIMLIYIYCCGSLMESFDQIKNIRQAIIDEKYPNPNDVDIVLYKIKAAYAYIKQIKTDSQHLLPNLSAKKVFEFEEFSSIFFFKFSIINILNFKYQIAVLAIHILLLWLIQFILKKTLLIRQNLCSTMFKLMLSVGNPSQDRLGCYFAYLVVYLKCLGYKCIMDRHLYKIQKEDYSEKNFTTMVLELLQLSHELKQICTIILTKQLNEDYMDVFKIQAKRWIAFCELQIRVHSGVTRNQLPIQPNETLLLNSGHFNILD